MSNGKWSMNRRDALKGLGLAAGATVLPFGAERVQAQAGGRIVVGTWGGDYGRLLSKNVEEPILKLKGFEIAQDQAADGPRRANMYEMNEAGALEQIDYAKIPNAANLQPQMKYPYGAGHIYSGKVIVYNPKMINPAPVSFKDAFDPKHGNKIGIIDIQYQYVMAAAALANGGSISNFEPGKTLLLEAKKAGARVYPTNEAFAQALKNEEIGIGIMWKARAVQWQNAGIPVESVAPSEGIPLYISGFSIPKNAPNKEGAYAYMNAMLEKQAQENFAADMGYNPTVTTASVPADLQKRIGFTAEEQKRLLDLDYGYIAKNDQALKEWWDKVFKA
jgi:putative spermidine/putrescine transport system substrate-binding protein